MPLKVEKRKNKDGTRSKNYWMRGSIEGIEIFRSTKTASKREADRIAADEEARIRTELKLLDENVKYFFEAVDDYAKKGKDLQYLPTINEHLGMTPLPNMTQDLIDEKADIAYPTQSPSSVRRWWYDPIATIMNHAHRKKWCDKLTLVKPDLPKVETEWAEFEWFDIVWEHCTPEFKAFSYLLSESGARAGEVLALTTDLVNLDEKWAYAPDTKNDEPRMIYLTDGVVEAMNEIMPEQGKIFHWRDHRAVNTYVRRLVQRINKNRKKENRQPIKYYSTHKFGSHTYATLGRRYLKFDETTLTRTGRWKDARSVQRYMHTNVREEAPRAEGFSRARKKVRAKDRA